MRSWTLPLTQGGQGSIGPLPLQPVTADLLVLPAAQHCGDQSGAEPLAGLRHTAEDGRASSPTSISWKLWRQL